MRDELVLLSGTFLCATLEFELTHNELKLLATLCAVVRGREWVEPHLLRLHESYHEAGLILMGDGYRRGDGNEALRIAGRILAKDASDDIACKLVVAAALRIR